MGVTGGELSGSCMARKAEEVVGVVGLGNSVHHLTREDHGGREGMTANSPRPRTEAGADQRRRTVRDGRRQTPKRVWRRRVSKRERGKEGK